MRKGSRPFKRTVFRSAQSRVRSLSSRPLLMRPAGTFAGRLPEAPKGRPIVAGAGKACGALRSVPRSRNRPPPETLQDMISGPAALDEVEPRFSGHLELVALAEPRSALGSASRNLAFGTLQDSGFGKCACLIRAFAGAPQLRQLLPWGECQKAYNPASRLIAQLFAICRDRVAGLGKRALQDRSIIPRNEGVKEHPSRL